MIVSGMANHLNIFEFINYRTFLNTFIENQPKPHGFKSVIAEKSGVQLAYLSSVLQNKTDLNVEQGYQFCLGFHFTEKETQYFILLIQHARAGTVSLKKFFLKQIEEVRALQLKVTARLEGESKVLTDDSKNIYYNSWMYAAIQVALTIPQLNTAQALAEYFGFKADLINEILTELEYIGLIEKSMGQYEATAWIKLNQDSKNLIRHHSNWRLQAIRQIESKYRENLHFSACYSLSAEDAIEIRDSLARKIKEVSKKIRTSKEEVLYAFNLDFWELKK